MNGQKAVLEMIAKGVALPETLTALDPPLGIP